MILTKEKLVAALAVVIGASGLLGIRKPTATLPPELPAEESARPAPGSPVPPLRPEKPWDAARDPFVPGSAWSDAEPAKLSGPPPVTLGRAWPAGSLPNAPRAPFVLMPKDPVPLKDEPDPNAPPPKEGE